MNLNVFFWFLFRVQTSTRSSGNMGCWSCCGFTCCGFNMNTIVLRTPAGILKIFEFVSESLKILILTNQFRKFITRHKKKFISRHKKNSFAYLWLMPIEKTKNQALRLRAWILEFEMSVHRICKFDPFWTDLIQKNPKIKWPFLFVLEMWQLFILTFFNMCNH